MKTQKITETLFIPEKMAGLRIDQALAQLFPQYSRSRLKEWLESGNITVNGEKLKPKNKIKGKEIIKLEAKLNEIIDHEPEDIQLTIVYEDDELIIINKPVGMVVHPAAGNHQGTLLNALLHHAPVLAQLPRAGIIHRLDKDTSGLLVIAKTLEAYTDLVKQLQNREISREYLAIISGALISGGTIDKPIGRDPRHRTKMAVNENGKPAITHYRILERFKDFTLVTVKLETGRTHQIRVHMAYIHHPIVGDQTYAGRLKFPKGASDVLCDQLKTFKRQALHAYKLGFEHPTQKTWMEWEAKIPNDIEQLITLLKREN